MQWQKCQVVGKGKNGWKGEGFFFNEFSLTHTITNTPTHPDLGKDAATACSPHSQETPTQHGFTSAASGGSSSRQPRRSHPSGGKQSLLRPQGRACSALASLSVCCSSREAPGRAKHNSPGPSATVLRLPAQRGGRPAAPFCWSGKGGTKARPRARERAARSVAGLLPPPPPPLLPPSLPSRQKRGPASGGCFHRGCQSRRRPRCLAAGPAPSPSGERGAFAEGSPPWVREGDDMHPSLTLTRATCTFPLSLGLQLQLLSGRVSPEPAMTSPTLKLEQCTSRATRLARLPLPQARPLGGK